MPITPTSTKSKQYQELGIDEIARDIETAFTAINQLEGGGGSGYTETIVNVSSDDAVCFAQLNSVNKNEPLKDFVTISNFENNLVLYFLSDDSQIVPLENGNGTLRVKIYHKTVTFGA